ncbi:MAG: chemotaxis protein CheX [Verrucomicrobiota bacterium]
MASLEIDDGSKIIDSEAPTNFSGVTGNVSVTGKTIGILYLNMPERLAAEIASGLMGSSPDSISVDDVNDVVGELTNMVTGNLKSKMCDQGYPCTLSIPTVLRGSDINIDSVEKEIVLSGELSINSTEHKVNICLFAKLEK